MKQMNSTRFLSLILCMALVAVAALMFVGCSDKKAEAAASSTVLPTAGEVLGEGANAFTFTFANKDGKELSCEVHTDEKTVGEALVKLNLIAGEQSEYGLYVKEVCGEYADYDTDGAYWAFYVNDDYAMSGVDQTDIESGATYALRYEK